MKAREFLRIYLGGNMFVETLTPKAIVEFAEDYHNKCVKELLIDFLMEIDEVYAMHIRENAEKCVDEYLK